MTIASHQEFRLPSSSSFCWDKSFFLQESACSLSQDDLHADAKAGDCDDADLLSRLIKIVEQAEDAVLADDILFGDMDFDPIVPTVSTTNSGDRQQGPQAILTFPQSSKMDEMLDIFIDSIVQDQESERPVPPPKRQKVVDDREDVSLFSPNPLTTMLNLDFFRGPELKNKQVETLKTPTTTTGVVQKEQEPRFRRYQADQWMDRFEDLIRFRQEHNHCLVPHSFPENQQLAQWVKRQRYQYKLKSLGRHSTLTDERQKELEDMGFVWDSHKAAWDERLEALKEYHAKYGNTLVPTNYEVDKPLAVWVKCQRRQLKLLRKGLPSTMTEERFQELEKLGFDWNPRNLSP